MKKLIVFYILFLSIPLMLNAQKAKVMNDPTHDSKPIHFGFSLGFNFMDFSVYQSEYATKKNIYAGVGTLMPGINIQAISNLRINDNWDLRCLPGISFGERHIDFVKLDAIAEDGSTYDSVMYDGETYRMESSFLELPILLKYKAKRMNNFRPYIIGGGNIRYDLAVKKEYDYEEQLIMVKPFDVYAEIGMGFDSYLTYFKFGFEIKYSVGLTDIFMTKSRNGNLPEDNPVYTDVLSGLKSHIFTISFHFE